jgi:hypothetical protein
MLKQNIYDREYEKLNNLFMDVDENSKKLIQGLIQDAAFLYAKNYELKNILDETGFIKINPKNKGFQKSIPAAKEYRQNLNSYTVVIKTLSGILEKKIDIDDDELEEYE